MMYRPLLLSSIVTYGETAFPYQEIVARRMDEGSDRTTFAAFGMRCRQVAEALRQELHVQPGECVATLAWNTMPHLELYFAIPGIAAICHTLNMRYSDEYLVYIINKARNRIVFVEFDQLNRLLGLIGKCPTLETIVVLSGDIPDFRDPIGIFGYEEVISAASPLGEWPEFDECAASSLCYSSGSTGDPKGALYSHRSTVLYTLTGLASGQMGIGAEDCILPAVPMFHVNGWCKAHQALVAGAKLVLPGSRMAGEDLVPLIDEEAVTSAFGVPTVWLDYFEHLGRNGTKPKTLKTIGFGGGTPTTELLRRVRDDFGIEYRCGFGMTETTTGLGAGFFGPDYSGADLDQQLKISRSMRPFFGIDMRIRRDDGRLAQRGGNTPGEMECRGHFVIQEYFEDAAATRSAVTQDGWFKTGDVVAIDTAGRFSVIDRLKDMIKSGGEWISSQALESAASSHPDIVESAVIGLPHPKWQERPFLIVRLKPNVDLDQDGIREHIARHTPKWWLPDAIEAVDELPRASTGKIDKRVLRKRFEKYAYAEDGMLRRFRE